MGVEAAMRLPPESVSWYTYCGITHAYSDGACGQALFGDLLRFYAEETGFVTTQELKSAEPFHLLQHRLRKSLRGRLPGDSDANDDVYHEIACEDWGKRPGMQVRIQFEPQVMRTF